MEIVEKHPPEPYNFGCKKQRKQTEIIFALQLVVFDNIYITMSCLFSITQLPVTKIKIVVVTNYKVEIKDSCMFFLTNKCTET